MRKVCQKIKQYIDGHKKVLGMFISMATKPNMPCKLILLFERGDNIKSALYKCITTRPNNIYSIWRFPDRACRGPLDIPINNKAVICSYHSVDSVFCDKLKLDYYKYLGQYMLNIYGYDFEKDKWKVVYPNCMYCIEENCQSTCPIADPELAHFYSDNSPHNTYLHIRYLNIRYSKELNLQTVKFCQYHIDLPPDCQRLRDFTLVRVSPKKVLFVGGYRQYYHRHMLLQGELCHNRNMIDWKVIDVGAIPIRIKPICFKLKNNVYIIGSSFVLPCFTNGAKFCNRHTCDMYNLPEEKYYQNIYSLPISIYQGIIKIAIDASETCALMLVHDTVSGKETVWTFTEAEGFQEISISQYSGNNLLQLNDWTSIKHDLLIRVE